MAYDDGGFKVCIKEKTSKEEILNNLAMALTYLETTHGIEEFSNINIYLQMYKDDERQMLVSPEDPSIQSKGFTLKPETEHKTFEVLSDGSKKIIYKKDVDFQKIQKTIDTLTKKPEVSKYKSISISKVEEARQKHQMYLSEKRQQAQAISNKKLEERNILEQKEKDLLFSFRQMIADKLSCSVHDLSKHTTSMNFITEQKTILKYLGSIEIPKEHKIFRVTYKDNITKKASLIEIYDLHKNLLNTISV